MDAVYVSVLLTSETLPPDVVAKVIAVVEEMDGHFLVKFAQAANTLKSPQVIVRALAIEALWQLRPEGARQLTRRAVSVDYVLIGSRSDKS